MGKIISEGFVFAIHYSYKCYKVWSCMVCITFFINRLNYSID